MKLISAIILGLFITTQAQAGITIEPYLGYFTGTQKTQNFSNSLTEQGLAYGARLGYTFTVLMAGIDYMSGSWTTNSTPTTNTTPTDIGAFIGFDVPLLRGYVEYLASSSEHWTYTGYDNTAQGTGIKAGVGYKFFPKLCIGLEYAIHTFTKDNSGTLVNQVSNSLVGLTLSAPF